MKKTTGFTLIELMIVVAIIGILAAIAIPKFADLIRKSNEGATKGNLGAIRSAVSIYYGEQEGTWPFVSGANTLASILTTNNGMFIKAMPNSYEPNYHAATSSVSLDAVGDDGYWGYENSLAGGVKTTGDVWVNCTHTDTKTTVWSTY